jgi:hypothetical protein
MLNISFMFVSCYNVAKLFDVGKAAFHLMLVCLCNEPSVVKPN